MTVGLPGFDEFLVALQPVLPEAPELAAYLDSVPALEQSAHYYAANGWPVFPLVAGGKTPVTTNGCKDATTDPTTIADWWRTMPHANIGVACGVKFDVIDIDQPRGFDSYRDFCDNLTVTHPDVLAVARTGNGGVHVLIPPQPGARNGANFAPDLDYRTVGGYIVIPPSRLYRANRYTWALPPDSRLLGAAA